MNTSDHFCPTVSTPDQGSGLPTVAPPYQGTGANPLVGLTLADVLERLAPDQTLSSKRRRDLSSCVRRASGLLARNPGSTPADTRALAYALDRINPAAHQIAPQTFSNIKSGLLAALNHVGVTRYPAVRSAPLSPEWDVLRQAMREKRHRDGLSRLTHFGSATGVAPEAVDDEVIGAFLDAVRVGTLVSDIGGLHRRTCRLWNEIVENHPDLGLSPVTVPDHRKPRETIPLAAFPESLRREVERHLVWLADTDPFADNPPPHRCKPRTIELRKKHIECAVSALQHSGYRLNEIRSLADLVEVNAAKDILRFYVEKNGREAKDYPCALATMLISVARHWVRVSPEELEKLKGLGRKVPRPPSGLTPKNRALIRKFRDPALRSRLIHLPRVLTARAERLYDHSPRKAATLAQLAMALEILLMAPMRMGNLINLQLDTHIVRTRGLVHIVLSEAEVKNDQYLEYELPEQSTDLYERYVQDFRPILAPGDSTWLFAVKGGAHKSQETLSQQLTEVLEREIGVHMTPHQFRHLAAAFYLEAHPDGLAMVSRILGHKDLRTTLMYYAELDSVRASQIYDEVITGLRKEHVPVRARRRRRRV